MPRTAKKDDGPWTAEAIEILTKMRAEGESVRVIAAAIGMSSGAVAGKINRLQLPQPDGVKIGFNQKSHKEHLGQPRAKRRKLPVSFTKLKEFHCRAITGTSKFGLALYCGTKRKAGTSWCDHHYRLYVQPKEPVHGETRPRK
jgi:hypothetical protein